MKPQILIIPNVPEWAFDITADQIISELSPYYTFTKKYSVDLKNKPDFNYNTYDCIYLLYWVDFRSLNIIVPNHKIISGVYSYTSWEHDHEGLKKENLNFGTLLVPTDQLKKDLAFLQRDIKVIPHAVDTSIFHPQDRSVSKKLRVGWAGNPDHNDRTYKGYWNIIKPLCEQHSDWIELKTAMPSNKIPHNKMPDFYNSLDVLVCMSKGETGPYPVLEAGACGIPVISTPVGLIPELIHSRKNGIIIERTTEALFNALQELYKNPVKRMEMGTILRADIIKNWSVQKIAQEYKKMFDYIINTSKNIN